jgi:REP element-mobilizing transposase RayT
MESKYFHGANLRKFRSSQSGRIYLVTFVTKNRIPLFLRRSLAQIVVTRLKNAPGAASLAYVVMPDHVHWLFQLRDNANLANEVQKVKSVSAHKINAALQRSGPLWQAGFHDHALRRDEDVKQAAQYVVANPIRAGLAKNINEYPYAYLAWE